MINKTLLTETLKKLKLDFTETSVEEGENFFTFRADFERFRLWFFLQGEEATITVHSQFKWQPEFDAQPAKLLAILNELNFATLIGGHLEAYFKGHVVRYVTYRHDPNQLEVNATQRQIAFQILTSGIIAETLGRFSEFPNDLSEAATAANTAYIEMMGSFVNEATEKG